MIRNSHARYLENTPEPVFSDPSARAASPLGSWHALISKNAFADFTALKATFGASVDYVDPLFVFDIGGNKFRLVVAIHFNKQRCYIRHILTHAEYDRGA